MKRCTGDHCPYGYGHHDEHRRAAIKGWQREQLRDALKGVKIRPFSDGRDAALYASVPSFYRTKAGTARSMDEIATDLANDRPELGIRSESDLALAFEKATRDRGNERYRRRLAA